MFSVYRRISDTNLEECPLVLLSALEECVVDRVGESIGGDLE